MENKKYINDLKDIKDIMNRSSRFISLSGLAGVSCGTIALVGAFFYYVQVMGSDIVDIYSTDGQELKALLIAVVTLLLALISTSLLTSRQSRKAGIKLWDVRTNQMITRFMVPLSTGGLLSLIAFYHGYSYLALPITLLFYGLGIYAISRFSYPELRSLGIVNIVLGLFASLFINYALIFWALGFGLMNTIYGIVVYYKYES